MRCAVFQAASRTLKKCHCCILLKWEFNGTIMRFNDSEAIICKIPRSLANHRVNKTNVENCYFLKLLLRGATPFLCPVSGRSRLSLWCRFRYSQRTHNENGFFPSHFMLINLSALEVGTCLFVCMHEAGGLNSPSLYWEQFPLAQG